MKKLTPNRSWQSLTGLFVLFLISTGAMMSCGDSTPENDNTVSGSTEMIKKIPLAKAAKLYSKRCALCHGEDGKKGLSGALDLSQSNMEMEQRVAIITTGKGQMMPFEAVMTKEEIVGVADYIGRFTK